MQIKLLNIEEDYEQKAKDIFNLINTFRKNPRELAKKLELIRTYLDPDTNILSEPNKIQIQMVEGDNVFKEAIQFLKSLPPLKPLQWDENLCRSAQEHVDDIGPKGLLLYQSSDGTEPEDRISKYGNYVESLGENIDFGPNDAMGVIISLTLDDGEEERPHRENIFKQDYQKVGIACGPHKTEFQMCVMDFAFDFQPLNAPNEMKVMMNKEDMMNNSNFANQNNPNNQSPLVKLSLENDDFKSKELLNNQQLVSNVNPGVVQNNQVVSNNEIDQLAFETSNLMKTLKVVNKKVEITTKITYTYEDGSTKVVTQNESHDFKS
jgi:uncharacterized protein YkwD